MFHNSPFKWQEPVICRLVVMRFFFFFQLMVILAYVSICVSDVLILRQMPVSCTSLQG